MFDSELTKKVRYKVNKHLRPKPLEDTMYYCGIDWSIEKLDFSVIDDNKDDNKLPVVTFNVKNNEEGYIEALSIIRELEDYPKIEFAIESSNQHIVLFLMQRKFTVFEVCPNSVYQARKSIKISGCRSDSLDAFLIAQYLKNNRVFLSPIQKDSSITEEIRILSTDRDSLVNEATRLKNQLTACLRDYFPQFLNCFSDYTCPTALDLLELYPTILEIRKVSDAELENFLKIHQSFTKKKVNKIKSAIQEEIAIEKVVIYTKKLKAIALVKQLKVVSKQIDFYNAEIDKLLKKHPDYYWIKTLPGVGNVLSSKVIKHFGDNREHFQRYQSLQALAGTSPVTSQSGKYRGVRFRFSCNKQFRDTMQLIAFCSIRESEWAKVYYKRKRDEGKNHNHALRCLANVWVKIIYTLWKKRECYSEEKHMASIGRHAYFNKS